MTNEKLNTRLYEKMAAEQTQYRNWLLTLPPAGLLQHAYEYSVREDIVMCMEELELPDKQAKALLRSKTPVADIYEKWQDRETGYMDQVRDTPESKANEIIRADFIRTRREER